MKSKQCLSIFLALSIASISRADPQDMQYKSSFQKGQDAQAEIAQQRDSINEQYATSKNLGFHETRSGEKPEASIGQILDDVIVTPRFESTLVVRVFCEIPNSQVLIFPRYKDISWSLEKSEKADKNLEFTSNGNAQTDSHGYARIRFSTRGSISDKKITLQLGAETKSFKLAQGPYEISVLEAYCKNKK